MTSSPNAVRCPACGSQRSRVRDSRPCDDLPAIRRRRHCIGCGHRYNTFETVGVPEEHLLAAKIAAAVSALADLEDTLNALTKHIRGEQDGLSGEKHTAIHVEDPRQVGGRLS